MSQEPNRLLDSNLILAVDPGTITGIACGEVRPQFPSLVVREIECTPTRRRKNTAIEQEHTRYGKLYYGLVEQLERLTSRIAGASNGVLVVEGAAGFLRGKSAVQVAHNLRGALKLMACIHDLHYVEVQPMDLKRFAVGKAMADKSEMIRAATEKYGYTGNSDNEADALLLFEYMRQQLTSPQGWTIQ